MKLWTLFSIFRAEPSVLEQLLQDSRWLPFLCLFRNFKQSVDSQDRMVLDADVPTDLAESAMIRCTYRFRVQSGQLCLCVDDGINALSSADVFHRYGGAAIEEVLEYGSFRIPVA